MLGHILAECKFGRNPGSSGEESILVSVASLRMFLEREVVHRLEAPALQNVVCRYSFDAASGLATRPDPSHWAACIDCKSVVAFYPVPMSHQSPHRICDTGVRVPSLSCFSRSATMPGVKRNVAHMNNFMPNARNNAQVVSYTFSALPAKHPARYAMTNSIRRSRA